MNALSRVCAVAAVLVGFSATEGLGETAVTWKENVRGWFIGVDKSLGNGCFMSSTFERGTGLRVGFDFNSNALDFIISDPDWRSIEAGKLYPVEVQFGNRSPWTGDALGFDWGDGLKSLILPLSFENEQAFAFVRELQQMRVVIVRYEGKTIANLSLRGSYVAMEEVLNCQRTMLETLTAPADPFFQSSGADVDPFD